MKITLDISKLVEDGKLTPEEAQRLTALASHETGSLGINILIGFGVVAIAAGAVALVPTPPGTPRISTRTGRCRNGAATSSRSPAAPSAAPISMRQRRC